MSKEISGLEQREFRPPRRTITVPTSESDLWAKVAIRDGLTRRGVEIRPVPQKDGETQNGHTPLDVTGYPVQIFELQAKVAQAVSEQK